eukprot:9780770-Karenia_brevis.AAC.1
MEVKKAKIGQDRPKMSQNRPTRAENEPKIPKSHRGSGAVAGCCGLPGGRGDQKLAELARGI